MSPEQAAPRTELVDERSDVYALGAVLCFLLSGHPPDTLSDPQPRIRPAGAKVPRPIEAVCRRALSASREDRYGSAQEVADDVVRFLDGEPVSAYAENIFEKTGRWLGKNRYVLLLIVAYLVMRAIVFFLVGR
jgi:serine/threonine-protein kinase